MGTGIALWDAYAYIGAVSGIVDHIKFSKFKLYCEIKSLIFYRIHFEGCFIKPIFDIFVGAIGCSLLAYILPCLIHLKIKGRAMRLRLIIKDLIIIFLSVMASILTMVVIIGEIASGKIK